MHECCLDEEDMAAHFWSEDRDGNGVADVMEAGDSLFVAVGRGDIGMESEEVLLAYCEPHCEQDFFFVAQNQFASYKNPTVICDNLCNVYSMEMGVKRKTLRV